ncbi:hypothetical protein [Companilactobacillus baiquanensis]|uniref:FAD:protein FMN transferase n=1 Tax=Companilactobacillus baiquanensis TaxID=2486005 RepID=A0ABW1UVY4_9LACO|nr:hypothetical protein [Companilactobacillus baiquanensis]
MVEKYNSLSCKVGDTDNQYSIKLITNDNTETVKELFQIASQNIEDYLREMDRQFSPDRKNSLVAEFQSGSQKPLMESATFSDIYTQTVIAEQMTHHYFSTNFGSKYDPTELIKGWIIDEGFNKYLKPLLNEANIVAVKFNDTSNTKISTKINSDYRWVIMIPKPESDQIAATYYLRNASIVTLQDKDVKHALISNKSHIQQVTVINNNVTDARVWAIAGLAVGTREFPKLISEAHLTGMMIDKKLGNINFREGSLGDILMKKY